MSNTETFKISTSMIMVRLNKIMSDDISFIKTLLEKKQEDEDIYELFDSLIGVKETIQSILPDKNSKRTQIPTPPVQGKILKYRFKENKLSSSDYDVLNSVTEVEKAQLNFVKKALSKHDLSDDMKSKLERILSIYTKVISHLERSLKTGDTRRIVL